MARTETLLFTTITPVSASFTKPAGVKKLLVECWGPGGGGGNPALGCGGGGAGYARSVLFYPPAERAISYKVPRGGNPDERWAFYTWWDDTGPETMVGEIAGIYSPLFPVYIKVGGSGGMGSPNVSQNAFGRTGGGRITGGLVWPNITGSVAAENYGYTGGNGARGGGGGGGGGGAAGPNGDGQSLNREVHQIAGGTGSGDFAGNGGNGGQAGFVYGGGGGGGSGAGGNPGGQGLIRVTVFYDEQIPASIEWNGNTLLIEYPFDNVNTYSAVIDGSEFVRIENGYEYALIPNTNFILEGDVRWIPTTSTATQTGWDGANGWRAFLEYARAKNPIKFYPDSRNTDFYIDSYLVEPLNGEHSLEIDGTRRISLVIRNTTTPYEGF